MTHHHEHPRPPAAEGRRADLRAPLASIDPDPRPWSSWRSVTAIEEGPAATFAFVAQALPPGPCRVLEIGCGTGWLALQLARHGHAVEAIDPSEESLAVATRTAAGQELPGRLAHRRVALESFDAPDGSADAVVFNLSLHHLDDLDGGLRKAGRWLAPGGRIIVHDFAYDRMDLRTMAWMRDTEALIAAACDVVPAAAPAPERLEEWTAHYEEHRLHRFAALTGGLRRTFAEDRYEVVPYLYVRISATRPPPPAGQPEPLISQVRALERRLLGAGAIQAVAYRFVGRGK